MNAAATPTTKCADMQNDPDRTPEDRAWARAVVDLHALHDSGAGRRELEEAERALDRAYAAVERARLLRLAR